MSEHDDADGGVHDSVHASARTALTVAIQMGEKIARMMQELAEEAARRDTAAAQQLGARFEAERTAAMAQLDVVNQPNWWDRATVEEVAQVAGTAEIWRDLDPRAAAATDTISSQLEARYGVDLPALIAAEQAKARDERTEAALLVSEADRLDGAAEARSSAVVDGPVDAGVQLERQALAYEAAAARGGDNGLTPTELRDLAADARDQAQLYRDTISGGEPSSTTIRADAGNVYDSAERRDALAASLEGKASPEEIAVRIRADVDQSRPAYEAVTTATARAKRRSSPSTPNGRSRDRGDRAR